MPRSTVTLAVPAPLPRLPFDVLLQICLFLGAIRAFKTLATLMRCSRSFYKLAGPMLYETLKIDDRTLEVLLASFGIDASTMAKDAKRTQNRVWKTVKLMSRVYQEYIEGKETVAIQPPSTTAPDRPILPPLFADEWEGWIAFKSPLRSRAHLSGAYRCFALFCRTRNMTWAFQCDGVVYQRMTELVLILSSGDVVMFPSVRRLVVHGNLVRHLLLKTLKGATTLFVIILQAAFQPDHFYMDCAIPEHPGTGGDLAQINLLYTLQQITRLKMWKTLQSVFIDGVPYTACFALPKARHTHIHLSDDGQYHPLEANFPDEIVTIFFGLLLTFDDQSRFDTIHFWNMRNAMGITDIQTEDELEERWKRAICDLLSVTAGRIDSSANELARRLESTSKLRFPSDDEVDRVFGWISEEL